MSLLQEMQKARKIIEKERSAALFDYCEKTGADMGKVIYTLEGWDEFIKWLENRDK